MRKPLDVALATCRHLPEPDPDREPLSDVLRAAGLRVAWYPWDDPAVDWSVARMTLLRSTWNYPQACDAFRSWLERVAAVSRLENPLELVLMNLHKGYLIDLAGRDIPVPPTELIRRGDVTELREIIRRNGWSDVVVKPAVSAASWRTLRVDHRNIDRGARHLEEIVADGDALVQGYMPSVEDYGERAIVVIEGRPTHAVRKSPRFGGDDESVSEARAPIHAREGELVGRVLEGLGQTPLYARVDVAPDDEGRPVVMELELIEPSLFFDQCPEALDRFVEALIRRLEAR